MVKKLLLIFLVCVGTVQSFDWKSAATGAALSSALTIPVISYGLIEEKAWIMYSGSAIGPTPGYFYANKGTTFTAIKTSSLIIVGGYFYSFCYAIGAAQATAMTGNEETDEKNAREVRNIQKNTFVVCAYSSVVHIGVAGLLSGFRQNNQEKIGFKIDPYRQSVQLSLSL